MMTGRESLFCDDSRSRMYGRIQVKGERTQTTAVGGDQHRMT